VNTNLLHSLEHFPPLRRSLERLNELAKAPEVDILAFARTIEADPMLFADLLRSVNAPFYGFRSQITSIRHALTLFGTSKIHGIALQLAMTEYAGDDLPAYGITLEQWLETMRLQQEFLFSLLKIGDDPSAFIKLSGVMFVLEMGKMAAEYVMQQMGNRHRFTQRSPEGLQAEERRVIGATGDELAAELFERWQFEAEFIDLFRHSMDAAHASRNQKLAATLQVARTLITVYGLQPLEHADTLIGTYGLNRDGIAAAYAGIAEASQIS